MSIHYFIVVVKCEVQIETGKSHCVSNDAKNILHFVMAFVHVQKCDDVEELPMLFPCFVAV